MHHTLIARNEPAGHDGSNALFSANAGAMLSRETQVCRVTTTTASVSRFARAVPRHTPELEIEKMRQTETGAELFRTAATNARRGRTASV